MALGVVGSNPIIHPKRKGHSHQADVLFISAKVNNGVWPNGKATDFDSVDAGSIPATPTKYSRMGRIPFGCISFLDGKFGLA